MELIENGNLAVEINLNGGTLHSVIYKKTGEQLLWQGDENSWKSRDIVIFPFVARLKDKHYTVDGKSYCMENHGLARYSSFSVCEKTADSLTITLSSDGESLKRYPFEFSFYVTYSLCENSMRVAFKTVNKSNTTMYFALGAHPAYNIPCDKNIDFDDISGSAIEFDRPFSLVRYKLNDSGEYINGTAAVNVKRIELSKRLFQKYSTLIFGGASGRVTLSKRGGGDILFDIGDVPYLALWSHKTRGGYVCIEPWCGLPDFENCDSELKNKQGINALPSGETFEYAYTTIYNV